VTDLSAMSNMPGRPDLIPPPWGRELTESDYTALKSSWITPEMAQDARLRRVDQYEGSATVGQKDKGDYAGILIPYYWPGDASAFNHRLRRDNPDWTQGKDGKPRQKRKYLSPPNGSNRLFIPIGVTLEQLADKQIPIVLVEGEKKALAVWRLAHYETANPRFIPVAIAGVWNWRGRIGKTGGPNGERLDVRGPIPDLSRIEWNDRTVFIVFDANVHTNDSVKWARKGVCRELTTRCAKVDFVNLPEGCGLNGIDDLLAAWGPARVLELFKSSFSGARLEVRSHPQFQSKPDGMFRTTGREQLSQIQMTNYQAAITTNIRLDDGVETRREFKIESELMGRKFNFTIAASEFARMDWPIERMGSSAQRDYARTAIQSFSITAEERCIYTHTGWRNVDGQWVYLHAAGAVGRTGVIPGVEVRLLGPMSRYELRPSESSDALRFAVRASLQLLDLGSPEIGFPLLAATYRAVLGEADFSIHVAGQTGAFKSEVAALHQQHFGPAMTRLNLPGTWSSTGNALEALAFYAKDALFVIDDFAPQGSGNDIARYHATADRVFRAAGNRAGRSRLDSTAGLREPKPPRALILSTGEDIPRGESIRARLFILEVAKDSIDASSLTRRQEDAQRGLYSQSMCGFVQWLAGRYEEMRARFNEKISQYRARAISNPAHARTPDIVANLQAAFEMFLEFGTETGAIETADHDELADRCWRALTCAAAAQSKHQVATEPAAKFLVHIRSLFSSGRAHLQARKGGIPARSPESCGWKRNHLDHWIPHGECVGWADEHNVYLEPTAAYRAVQVAGREMGEVLAISEQTLRKRLHEKRWLASVDKPRQTLTIRRSMCGSSQNVLHFLRSTILPEVSDGDEGAE
jgi:hypothetical protein